jgi:hypothetical protein
MQTFAVEPSLLAALVTGAIHCYDLRRALDAPADLLWSLTTIGEPNAGKLPVRFGGRGEAFFVPTPISASSRPPRSEHAVHSVRAFPGQKAPSESKPQA